MSNLQVSRVQDAPRAALSPRPARHVPGGEVPRSRSVVASQRAVSLEVVEKDVYQLSLRLHAKQFPTSFSSAQPGAPYGIEEDNDLFSMHPYYWGDCTCGFDASEAYWEEEHPHLPECFQSALEARDFKDPEDLARRWKLSREGCMLHCTCGAVDEYQEHAASLIHPASCPSVRPNLLFKKEAIEVRWYKYIGRGMEVSRSLTSPLPSPVSAKEWQAAMSAASSFLGH